MPPGLYEIVITDKSEGEVGGELLEGDFNVRIEERGLDDIRALGCNSIEDEREFEAVARVSQLNNALVLDLRSALAKGMGHAADGLCRARDAAFASEVCAVFGQESDDAHGGAAGRQGPRRAQDAGRRQPLRDNAGTSLGNGDGMA